jgi:hypothetical protein
MPTDREIIGRTTGAMRRRPTVIRVPLLTPCLSSDWVALVDGREEKPGFDDAVEAARSR